MPPLGSQVVTLPSGGVALGAGRRALIALEFQGLAAVPHEAEWFANIDNPRTRRAYRIDIHEFMGFVGIGRPEEFLIVTRMQRQVPHFTAFAVYPQMQHPAS
jgi:hypothetical protein